MVTSTAPPGFIRSLNWWIAWWGPERSVWKVPVLLREVSALLPWWFTT
jgi:hypothetical protein